MKTRVPDFFSKFTGGVPRLYKTKNYEFVVFCELFGGVPPEKIWKKKNIAVCFYMIKKIFNPVAALTKKFQPFYLNIASKRACFDFQIRANFKS